MTKQTIVVVALALFAGGCDKKENKGEGSSTKTTETDKAAGKPIAADFFGKTVAPPGDLGKLKIGMPVADAIAAAPALLPEKTAKDYQTSPIPGTDGPDFAVGLDDAMTKIDRMAISGLPATTLQMLAQAWGPGKDAKDTIDRARTYWFDPATGWRAYAEVSFGDEYLLEFHNYIPYQKLLGETPEPVLAFAPQGLVGATLDDLRARHKDTLIETTAEQEAQQRKDIEKFAGQKLDELGATKADARLELPPTEWEQYWTRINFHWSDDNKIRVVWISIPYRAHPAAKDEIFAFFKKKWGEPKQFEDLGEPAFEFRKENPRVVVEDDTITGAWKLELTPKADD